MATETERCVDELMIKVNNIERQIEELQVDQQGSIQVDEARKLIADLQSFIDNNKPAIPPYCLKKAIEASNKLELIIDEPLKKAKVQFKFKSVSKPSKHSIDLDSKTEKKFTTIEPVIEKSKCSASVPVFGFVNKTNESLTLGIEQAYMKDISLFNLRGCNVVIHGVAGTIYINDLQDTSVTICLARRAITLTDCSNCSFKLVCQQLRIRSTINTKFETFVSCRSMLESSKGLEFRGIRWDSLGISDDQVSRLLSETGFDRSNNNWRMIDDFDNLARGESSDNFTRADD